MVVMRTITFPPQLQYTKTTTHLMCTKLDFPPVSSAIIWARQVRKLGSMIQYTVYST